MDAYDIALLMANQDSGRPLKMRYATVTDSAGDLLQIIPDGQTETAVATKCCHPLKGDRVILLVSGTEWLAVSVIGGESAPPRIGQPFITATDEDPRELWPETAWRKLEDRFVIASGSRNRGEMGGEEAHRLTVDEMPEVSYWLPNANTGHSYSVTDLVSRGNFYGFNAGHIGRSLEHNNMPPFEVFDIWIRTK